VSNTPQPVAPPSPLPVQMNAPPAPPAPPVQTAAVISASSCEKPEYPSASKRLEEEGTVTLKFLVGADGKVLESAIEKTSGFRRLDEAARAGLSKCQFKPGTIDGKPQQSWASMKYTWRLE
jgi:periplasmic protein TonB